MRAVFFRAAVLIFILITSLLLVLWYFLNCGTHNELISLFPIENYDQTISHWAKPSHVDYDKPLLSPAQQKIRNDEWFDHYYGRYSPWSPDYVRKIYATVSPQGLKSGEQDKINFFSNKNKLAPEIGQGVNFRPYPDDWAARLQAKMNLTQFDKADYRPAKRAIAIDNINARQLPTDEVHFYSQKIAGQGYPFDNLQAAVIWAGTPLYVLGETLGHDWSLVLAPSFIAWVKSTTVAAVDGGFVKLWQQQAKKNLIATTQTNVPITDIENNIYRFSGYIGMVFPGVLKKNKFDLWVPVSDEQRKAHIHHAYLATPQAALFPLLPTPHHFANIISQLIGRPYGWGGMYFYNDCASELKNIYTPFGTWLPAHSSAQADPTQYRIETVDLSNRNLDARLDYLVTKGRPWMTIVYIGGHVLMYVGSFPNPTGHGAKMVALSYQNVWGLKPRLSIFNEDRRAVIGKAVFLPLLKKYPEDLALVPLAGKDYFIMAFLDVSPKNVARVPQKIDLHSLLSP